MFMSIREHFANVHVHITSQMYVHEQFTKYHELFVKVRKLGGNFFAAYRKNSRALFSESTLCVVFQ